MPTKEATPAQRREIAATLDALERHFRIAILRKVFADARKEKKDE